MIFFSPQQKFESNKKNKNWQLLLWQEKVRKLKGCKKRNLLLKNKWMYVFFLKFFALAAQSSCQMAGQSPFPTREKIAQTHTRTHTYH